MYRIQVVEYAERWTEGGTESYILNIIRKINHEKFDVQIVVAQKETELYDSELAEYGCEVKSLLNKIYENPIERVMATQHIFRNYFDRNRCDILHLHIIQGVALKYAKYAKSCGIRKVVAHCHNTEIGTGHKILKLLGHYLGKHYYRQYVDEKIACSDLAAKWLYTKRDINQGKVKIYKYIVEMDIFQFNIGIRNEMRRKYGVGKEKVYLSIGRMEYQKNQLFLLDVFKEISKAEPLSKFILIGTGSLKESTLEHAHNIGIYEKVIFIEKTREIPSYMWMADVFILPSLFEGNPIVGIEAQGAGLSCIFADTITKEAKVLNTVIYISLKRDAKYWADKIITNSLMSYDSRIVAAEIMRNSGYEIKQQTHELEKMYMKNNIY